MSVAILIFAAGNSSRLGRPKQLLDYRGGNLLNRIIAESVFFANEAVVVVTGSRRQAIEDTIKYEPVFICHNSNWRNGMASSIQAGLKRLLLLYPGLRSCIITVCDQPYLDAEIFHSLAVAQQQTGKGIVTSAYAGGIGVPVLFTDRYFDALLQLEGQEGAQKLLVKYKNDLAIIPFPKGNIDIDTDEDYNKLINS